MKSIKAIVVIMICAAILGFFAGCEADGDGTVSLTVEPSYVDLTASTASNGNNTQTFVVTGGLRTLSLPLTWSVSNPGLGYIGGHGGSSASYISSGGHGNNSIIVRDQYGAEGVATVKQ